MFNLCINKIINQLIKLLVMENQKELMYAVIYNEFVEGQMSCLILGFYPTKKEAYKAMKDDYVTILDNVGTRVIDNEYKSSDEIQLDVDDYTHYHYEIKEINPEYKVINMKK